MAGKGTKGWMLIRAGRQKPKREDRGRTWNGGMARRGGGGDGGQVTGDRERRGRRSEGW